MAVPKMQKPVSAGMTKPIEKAKQASKKEIILEPRRKFNYCSDPNIFYDFVIIGGGVAGFAAAMYAGRLGLKTLVIAELLGGTITLTEVVENYPGFISIDGPDLARVIENHARDYDIDILKKRVEKLEMHKKGVKRHFKILTKNKAFFAKSILIATGTKVKKLGVPGEKQYSGKGVSYCVLCDGPIFKNKITGIVGGSDSAVKEAILLAEYAKKVYIIYRGEKVHPEPITLKNLQKKIKEGKIEIIPNTNITEIKGETLLKEVILDKPYKGKKEFKLDGLFVYIGNIPLNGLVKSLKVRSNKKGEVKINKNSETSLKGLYAAGDLTDTEWKQAITGVSEGVTAAYSAYNYVSDGRCVLPLKLKKKK